MTDKKLATIFGKTVRELRTKRGLSQEAFADSCHLHRTYIGSIERGEKNVTLATASRLAAALDLTLTELMLQVEQYDNDSNTK